ncbi:Casein kinase II subunit beta [Strongyloides ratti]|uniref:Casein kinase II subunit beta n=1 Tax=Strongyloides ratti TaxID=34506 RepID=A0A090L8P6_STRRB|nr:Casein kinase II subunit beta [Strongyloides ratti]CEF66112.1 Casein kinase II subunit beta [Strongyloides ratti]
MFFPKYNFVDRHLSKKSSRWLTRVPDDFFIDKFNLVGIYDILGIKSLERAVSLIMNNTNDIEEIDFTSIEKNAVFLYGLVHARYIITPEGLNDMKEKFMNNDFGNCLKVSCLGQSLLPIGLHDTPSHEEVKMFCPKCQDIYHPEVESEDEIETPSEDGSEDSFYLMEDNFCDGAFFGTGFPEFFFFHFPFLRPKNDKSI